MEDEYAQLLLPEAITVQSPSMCDGISKETEQLHRFWGCELIQEAGILLRLPQVVMVTAQTLLHRFYYRKSLKGFDAFRVAIGCLFLAAKVEERSKRIREVLTVFYAIYRRRKWGQTQLSDQVLDPEGAVHCLWKDWLVMVERQVLIDLGFSLYTIMQHPHKFILYYVKVLDGSNELAQCAWNYLNDSMRIDVCTRYRPEDIACAAIMLASRKLQIKLPKDPVWWSLFEVNEAELMAVARELMEMYTRQQTKVDWLDALTQVDPFAVDDQPKRGIELEAKGFEKPTQEKADNDVKQKPVKESTKSERKPRDRSTSRERDRGRRVSRRDSRERSRRCSRSSGRQSSSRRHRSRSRSRCHSRRRDRRSSRSNSRRR